MSKMNFGFMFACIIMLAFFSFCTSTFAEAAPDRIKILEKRLSQLEPPHPITIIDLPETIEKESEKFYPSNTIPISEVIGSGTKIPFNIIKNDPKYKRPVYEENWHSMYWGGRWSYIPSRIHTALHRMFTTYDIGLSAEMVFKENVGIDFPMFHNKTDLDLYIVVFQTKVNDVYTKGNQVVVVGTPERHGVEVITVKTGDIHPSDKEKLLLVQLATNGHEIDYSLIAYEPPDFWLKQKSLNQSLKRIKQY